MNEVELKILEAYTRDVGRGVARIDYDSMDKLDITTGDVIEILGNSKVVAKALPLYPSDEGKGIMRIDGVARSGLKSELASSVKIRKVKSALAEFVLVSPLESIPPIDERYLADVLEGNPIIEGMVVVIPYFGGRIKFIINEIKPSGLPAIITQKTEFKIADVQSLELLKFDNIIKEKKKQILEKFSKSIQDKKLEDIVEVFKDVKNQMNILDESRKQMRELIHFGTEHKSLSCAFEEALDEWIKRQKEI